LEVQNKEANLTFSWKEIFQQPLILGWCPFPKPFKPFFLARFNPQIIPGFRGTPSFGD